jgi:ubiquinone/menaquinone biosynthesis C-methylase UbiE
MADIPYQRWADFISFQIRRLGIKKPVIGDLACGTGRLAAHLAKQYQVWGIDNCPEMLALATSRLDQGLFLHGTLTDLNQPADVFICTCDGVNHILSLKDVVTILRRVHNLLPIGGLFLFDINSPHKYSRVLADHIFYFPLDQGGHLIWENMYQNPRSMAKLQFFLPVKPGLFQRAETLIEERCYSVATLAYWLQVCGFSLIGLWDDYTLRSISAKTQRIVFSAVKTNLRSGIREI